MPNLHHAFQVRETERRTKRSQIMSDAVRGERLKMRLGRENAHALFGIHIQNPMRVQQNQVQMLGTEGIQVINR